MAGIDKIYTNSYNSYIEFKKWAYTQKVVFFNGHTQCIGNWIWDLEEKDFNGEEIPITNTPTWLDIHLIQNCKIQFVLDRMQEVYNKETYEELKNIDLTAKPSPLFKQNRRILISKTEETKFPLHSKPRGRKFKWMLSTVPNGWWYDEESKTWSHNSSYYPNDTNVAFLTSIKSLVRHLRKQYLPKGLQFKIYGKLVGEVYLITIN